MIFTPQQLLWGLSSVLPIKHTNKNRTQKVRFLLVCPTRLELAQLSNGHYHLKVACLPIPPRARIPSFYQIFAKNQGVIPAPQSANTKSPHSEE